MAGTKDILLGKIRDGGALSGAQQLKLCMYLSYPAILAQLSSVLMQYIDTAMVGHLGAAAGASIGLVSTCMWMFGGFVSWTLWNLSLPYGRIHRRLFL